VRMTEGEDCGAVILSRGHRFVLTYLHVALRERERNIGRDKTERGREGQ